MNRIVTSDRELRNVQLWQTVKAEWWTWALTFGVTFAIACYSMSVAVIGSITAAITLVANSFRNQSRTPWARTALLTVMNATALTVVYLWN